jgi:hypothetical protein
MRTIAEQLNPNQQAVGQFVDVYIVPAVHGSEGISARAKGGNASCLLWSMHPRLHARSPTPAL